jgi:diguanylate cyclase (GGDEF)-like protein
VALGLYEAEGPDPVARCLVRVMARGSIRWSEPTRIDTRRAFDTLPRADAARTLAVLPLVRHNRPLGFLAFEASSLAPCASIALQVAAAVESVRLHAAVRSLTVTDELTGLHNRRFFESELRREADRSRRYGRDIALVMIDVDHFKAYNDSFGHRAGDEALRHVALNLVAAVQRRLDAVSRYGGEEFAVLLAETDREGALQVAGRIRRAVESSGEFLRPLTISAGVASLRGEAAEPEELVLRADRALYRAKAEGRNRVCD